MPLKALLVVVGWKLLTAHGTNLPVALNVLFKLALVVVWGKHHIAERAFLVHIKTSWGGGEKAKREQLISIYSVNAN